MCVDAFTFTFTDISKENTNSIICIIGYVTHVMANQDDETNTANSSLANLFILFLFYLFISPHLPTSVVTT